MHIKGWIKITIIIILIICSIFLYSRFLGTKGIEVKEYAIVNSKIPSNFYGLKIVQISDIHYKMTTDKNDLKKIVKEINLLKPDIVLLSGDLFDTSIVYSQEDFKDITKLLKSIDYNIGKFAIKGEDDLKIKNWKTIINDSDFININDSHEFIYNGSTEPILLVGISSNYADNHIKETVDNIYKEIDMEYKFSILLMHEPDFINNIDYSKFNLILAGHSHNGQVVLPFIGGLIRDKFAKNYYKNYYDLGNTDIYISSGIGTSKYKFRFCNKPSFNLYRLRNK